MNFKTTLLLATALGGLTILYLWRPQPDFAADLPEVQAMGSTSVAARKVIDPPLGSIEKIAIQRDGEQEWAFEKTAADASGSNQESWRMTSPTEMTVLRWAINRVGTDLGNLEYEISYQPGDAGGVSRKQAGLYPPGVTVTLTDAEGNSATVEIGHPASGNDTYVALAGDDRVMVANRSLSKLIKTEAIEYRDQQVWTFDKANVTRVEIVDRSERSSPVNYAFSRADGAWMMESPAAAKATAKVDEMLNAISRLRSIKWHDDDPDRWATYGLMDPMLTVRATVEETIEKEATAEEGEEADEATEKPPIETTTTVYVLHVSSQSPIGESTKSFIRAGDQPAVGTIMKSVVDKLVPKLAEWREMHVTTANINGATGFSLTTPDGSIRLIRRDKQWFYEDGDGKVPTEAADTEAVGELLDAIADLKAVAFVDGEDMDTDAMGLAAPRVDIRLTIPGREEQERLALGGFTDQQLKRLVYVRRNQVQSVAKVRTSDVAPMLRGPLAYRDRAVVDVLANRIQRIEIDSAATCGEGRSSVTLDRGESGWAITLPVQADVQADRVEELVAALASMRADAVVSESGESSAFGLHDPALRVVITHRPSVEVKLSEDEETKKLVPHEVQPPDKLVEVHFSEHDGEHFAKRADRSVVYRINAAAFEVVAKEMRSSKVLEFEKNDVLRFAIRDGAITHTFERQEDSWRYLTVPDLPVDSKKVDDLLLRIRDLKAERFVDHAAASWAAFDAAPPAQEVSVTLESGTALALQVSSVACQSGLAKDRFAVVAGSAGVFLLSADTLDRFAVSLDELE